MSRGKVIGGCIVFSLLIYFVFAVLPDTFDFYPLPTGGWDWLAFVGIIFSAIVAIEGITLTLKNENENMRRQQQLSVLPCLDANSFNPFDKANPNNIFRVITEENKKLVNDGYIVPRNVNKIPDNFMDSANIKVKNVGLSTAFSINTFIFKIDSIEGIKSLDDIGRERNREIVDNFYDRIKISNYEYKENDELLNNEWQIYTSFNLTNDSRSEINFVFDLKSIVSKFYSVIEFRFNDIYENSYYQLLFFYFDSQKVKMMPISKVYEGRSSRK